MRWKDGIVGRLNSGVSALLKKAGVKIVEGWARFRDGKTVEVETEIGLQVIRAEQVVIATGSDPVELPFLPFGGTVISSTGALALTEVPRNACRRGRRLYRAGAGYRLCQDGRRVTVVEAQSAHPAAIRRRADAAGRQAPARARRHGADRRQGEGTRARRTARSSSSGRRRGNDACRRQDPRHGRPQAGDREAGASKRSTSTWTARSSASTTKCRTSMRGVYAIGDVTGEPMLAHRAMAQGEMVAEIVAGEKRAWDKVCIPAICFTDPEIVTVGLSPEEARAAGIEIKTGYSRSGPMAAR